MSAVMPDALEGAIAIVGMAGRFPGARDVGEYWANVLAGVRSLEEFGEAELLARGVDAMQLRQSNYVWTGTTIDGVDRFDAGFFGYTPREAEIMDPQHRLFLETTWEALEHAGCDPANLNGSVGVYAGSGFPSYMSMVVNSDASLKETVGDLQLAVGNERDFAGDDGVVQAGPAGTEPCGADLLLDLAGRRPHGLPELLTFECDLAVAGGVVGERSARRGLRLRGGRHPVARRPLPAVSTRGPAARCMGNGVGVVVLRRLEDAIADGDTIYAVIRGSAVNNDGALKVGFTAPGLDGQAT